VIDRPEIKNHLQAVLFDQSADNVFNTDHFAKIDIAGNVNHGNILNVILR